VLDLSTEQYDFGISNIATPTEPQPMEQNDNSSAKPHQAQSLLTGRTAFSVSASRTASRTASGNHPVISASVLQQKQKLKKTSWSTSSELSLESDNHNIPTTSGSDVYFPLSVSHEEAEPTIIDTSDMLADENELKSEHMDMQPGTPSSVTSDSSGIPESPVPVSGPIPSFKRMAAGSKGSPEKEKKVGVSFHCSENGFKFITFAS
jgi:hypothetical protein